MRFRTDFHFDRFLGLIPGEQSPARVACELPAKFDNADIIGFPFPMDEVLYEMPTNDVCQLLSDFFGVPVGEDALAALRDCTLIGDGSCPYCGGEMEWWANDYDYDEEDGHRVDIQVLRCQECGYQEEVLC